MSPAAKESESFTVMKVTVERLSPHYLHILDLYFFNDDKVTVYKTIFKSIEDRSPWSGHTWNDVYYELVAFYALKYSHNTQCVYETLGGWHCGFSAAKSKCHYTSSTQDIHCSWNIYWNCTTIATSPGAYWCPGINTGHKHFASIAMTWIREV